MSPTSTAKRPAPSAGRKPTTPAARRLPIALIAGVALAAGLVAVIVVTMGSASEAVEVGSPVVTGEALPPFESIESETGLGLTIPEVTGADFAGTPASIIRDGRPKVIVFFAHWCSVCRQEMPLIADWLPGAGLPTGLDIVAVSTGVDKNQVNYPPSAWFEAEGWTAPLIADDETGSVARAFGLTAYPYFVFVDAEGRVALRLIGAITTDTLAAVIAELGAA